MANILYDSADDPKFSVERFGRRVLERALLKSTGWGYARKRKVIRARLRKLAREGK